MTSRRFKLDGSLGAGSDMFRLESGPEWEAKQERAALFVASQAKDAGDCADLLAALGLTEAARTRGSRAAEAPDAPAA
jgi:hypothetical protein